MKPIKDVFPNPTVKKVVFQIIFPNLFYIENKIGDFQLKIMNLFPISLLAFRKQFLFADIGPNANIDTQNPDQSGANTKIWQFKNEEGVELSLQSNSLGILSTTHKTYDNKKSEKRFRDTISYVVDAFIDITSIPIINRIGLRYIDECPLRKRTNLEMSKSFDTAFNLQRFDIAKALNMDFTTVIERDGKFLRYIESLKRNNDNDKIVLDFDGFANNIQSKDYLKTLDELHELISTEFFATIKSPIIKYMKQE